MKSKVELNYPLGTIIILCSNEPGPLIIGEVVDYEDYGKDDNFIIYRNVINDRKFVTWNKKPQVWTPEREAALRKLNWAERYNVTATYDSITEQERLRKESFDYLGYEYNEDIKGMTKELEKRDRAISFLKQNLEQLSKEKFYIHVDEEIIKDFNFRLRRVEEILNE